MPGIIRSGGFYGAAGRAGMSDNAQTRGGGDTLECQIRNVEDGKNTQRECHESKPEKSYIEPPDQKIIRKLMLDFVRIFGEKFPLGIAKVSITYPDGTFAATEHRPSGVEDK